jgi:CDP-glucose 4,6-dehydratase
LDALCGYLTLAENLYDKGPAFAQAWNFGPYESDIQPVGWLVDRLIDLWGDGATWEQDRSYHAHEANSLSLDCAKARLKLGWKPKIPLEQGLERIIAWTKAYQSGADMHQISKAEIDKFLHL